MAAVHDMPGFDQGARRGKHPVRAHHLVASARAAYLMHRYLAYCRRFVASERERRNRDLFVADYGQADVRSSGGAPRGPSMSTTTSRRSGGQIVAHRSPAATAGTHDHRARDLAP